jgi:hypothetical protein
MVVAFTCFVVAFNSAVITPDIEGVAKAFHVSNEVALLSITLFVIGFGIGKLTMHLCPLDITHAFHGRQANDFLPNSETQLGLS